MTPSVLAVFTLMISSIFVDCRTGQHAVRVSSLLESGLGRCDSSVGQPCSTCGHACRASG